MSDEIEKQAWERLTGGLSGGGNRSAARATGALPPNKGSVGSVGDASQAWAAEEGAGCKSPATGSCDRRQAAGARAPSQPASHWPLGRARSRCLFLGTSAARPSPRFSWGKFLACLAGIARLGLGAFCAGDSGTRTGDERRKAALALTGLGPRLLATGCGMNRLGQMP